MQIDEELMMIDIDFQTKEEVLEAMGTRLYELGYVADDFIENVLDREENFPTGLPTSPYAVAIPHTDTDKVIEPGIALATLKEPVPFSSMGNAELEVGVKIVFMLAVDAPGEQVTTLQNLIEMVQDERVVSKLATVRSIDECNKVLDDFKEQKN
ncbi:PTS sugar transporter subunit IIA [Salinicoccus carnicancri]|uniref:PTS sugar transporter subunit IIA n=1 Tax=Salinicoccus carnicancri TaxID=558170 RepID=UPI0002E44E49|nr:PTS sugar transporter subunit IIA [Salinicoccus carnicancri]